MTWRNVDSDADLRTLNEHVCWSDSEVVEFHGTLLNFGFFPTDVCRSGYINPNIFVLVRTCPVNEYLEMVWIDCDHFSGPFIIHPFLNGRVTALKRVEIVNFRGELEMRCSRLIYRFLQAGEVTPGQFYRPAASTRELRDSY